MNFNIIEQTMKAFTHEDLAGMYYLAIVREESLRLYKNRLEAFINEIKIPESNHPDRLRYLKSLKTSVLLDEHVSNDSDIEYMKQVAEKIGITSDIQHANSIKLSKRGRKRS